MGNQQLSWYEFIGDFILKHFVWIVPIVILIAFWNPALFVVFIPFLVTFIYCSWKKYDKERENTQKITPQKHSKLICGLYYAAILLFLILTMFATYFGMTKVFAMEKDGFWVALGISFGVPLALFAIVMITKARKTPALVVAAFALYVLFDGLVALPFNFLFFYDHLAKCERVENDERYFQTVIDDCDSIIAPKVKYFSSVYENLTDTTATKEILKSKTTNLSSNKQAEIDNLKDDHSNGNIDQDTYNRKMANITTKYQNKIAGNSNTTNKKNEQNATKATQIKDSLSFYKTLQVKIDSCKTLQDKLTDASKLDDKTPLVNQIRTLLSETCNESQIHFLQSKVKSLRAEKLSSIHSVRSFYEWIINIIKGNIEKNMTIIMSFSISIVIDILPLLLSLLYIVYKRND